MAADSLSLGSSAKKSFVDGKAKRPAMTQFTLRFDGHNKDITEAYYWHLHFPYFTGKGYTAVKLEDHHYFSEASQFGTNIRQVKGNSIRAFQENLNQLVQLVKVHLMPLLKEVKQTHFYKQWFDQITENDEKIQEELRKPGSQQNQENLRVWRRNRDEAISHIKDKWVMEVDGGRLWQMNRSQSEQGLDFALLPQLFFGINLEDPFATRRSLAEQLEGDIYSVDISQTAKNQVGNFLYRFYTWLPTAVKETNVTFKMKISSLKQFYSQLQMYMNFMKPLLQEIANKSEGLERENFYHGHAEANPDLVNLFDYSYSFIKVLGIRDFARGGFSMDDIVFSRFGLYIGNKKGIAFGEHAGKTGFIINHELEDKSYGGKKVKHYHFIPYEGKPEDLTQSKFNALKEEWKKNPKYVHRDDLRTFPIMEMNFSQRRRMEVINTEQGSQQVPYMMNKIVYKPYVWNLHEIATYREELREDNLELLETFVEEVASMREDLLYYVHDLAGEEGGSFDEGEQNTSGKGSSRKKFSTDDWPVIFDPIKGIGDIFSPLIPESPFKGVSLKRQKAGKDQKKEDHHLINKLSVIEDVWKVYNVFKKSHGYMQY